ncbi:hypothetical protein [Fimbriiglobus ruber]|uniref:Uncharacterized protein n=1 Tax=Fimbriiglobus ruber TaxID=1908690 RepID=A0A225DXB9_9BACT|nr:hypothetical protein [Fimbriiglobus ruber]OWK41849.1 hypothetical protein FRUB_03927 [Fimbriiglobus ruber]
MAFHYLDDERGLREKWTFHYTGADLAPRARAKAVALLEEERGIERAMAACQAGAAYSGRSEDLSRFRSRLQEKGEQRERCELLARELTRAGDQVFALEVADIVYFDMDDAISDPTTVVVPGG